MSESARVRQGAARGTTDIRITAKAMPAANEAPIEREFMGVSPTGQRIVSSGVDILHVRHDRVTEAWHYSDDGALRQLGSPR